MQLMIKPTLECQFKCSFCSAANCTQGSDLNKLVDSIAQIVPDDIIVTGGEPLLVDVSFYEKLLSVNDKMTLSFTSNLWDFYCHPEKWTQFFRNPRVSIGTSFQYGNGRIKPNGMPFTEDDFIKAIAAFEKNVGYVPAFISVISSENEDRALDHVLLAKKLNTKCRLNGVYPSGRSKEYYPRHKMLDMYMKIIDLGLDEYEITASERQLGNCPFNTNHKCAQYNRALHIDRNGALKCSFCEDLLFSKIAVYDDISELDDVSYRNAIGILPAKCYICPAYSICHSCLFHSRIINSKVNTSYCSQMVQAVDMLKKHGFKT